MTAGSAGENLVAEMVNPGGIPGYETGLLSALRGATLRS